MSERERFEEGMPGLLKAMRWAYDNFYIKGYSNSDEREGYISALEDDLPVLFGQVDDLVALVARLARSLRKATPADALADGAMDYLRRKGLNPSPLRTVPEPGQAASGSSQGARSDGLKKLADVLPEFPPFPTWVEANDTRSLLSWAEQVRRDAFEAGRACGLSVRGDMLGNLLARIHGDGGHYIDEHGLEKAFADGDAKVVELRSVDAARAGQPEAPTAAALVPAARMHPDGERVVIERQYADAATSGGASWTVLKDFTIKLYTHPPARSGAGSEEGGQG